MRIYDLAAILKHGEEAKPAHELIGSKDYAYTNAVWGPLNKTIYISTNTGRVKIYDVAT